MDWSVRSLLVCCRSKGRSYSIVAALGSTSGGRVEAAIIEKAASDKRKRDQAAYDKATAELAALNGRLISILG